MIKTKKIMLSLILLFVMLISFIYTNHVYNVKKLEEKITNQINNTFFLNPLIEFNDIIEFDECKSSEISGYKLYGGFYNNKIIMIFEKDDYKIMAFEDDFFNTVELIQNKYQMRLCETYKFILDNR